MPRGTTQRVTRGASNDWCQTVQVAGTRYCSSTRWQTRQYEYNGNLKEYTRNLKEFSGSSKEYNGNFQGM
ncbi:hypothetical protein Tco_0060004 [Tanacetum coccineum]